jgi:hypothetical protein
MKYDGNCLCGTVRWRIDGPMSNVTHCHCQMCRKAHGTAFATYANTNRSSLHWLSDESAVSGYASSPGSERKFCSHCGSVVPEAFGDSLYFVPLANMDGADLPQPTAHIFVASRAPWYTITDTLPQHAAYPPGVDAQPIKQPATRSAASTQPDLLNGSCLCGVVSYAVSMPLTRVQHCHCRRCRKARSAAHATNGFTPARALTFTRGADRLAHYKIPDAQFFTQVFCKTCGSPMPRIDLDRDIAVIPLGSLDDHPCRTADAHIYVGSRAPWFTITDAVPQFDERS